MTRKFVQKISKGSVDLTSASTSTSASISETSSQVSSSVSADRLGMQFEQDFDAFDGQPWTLKSGSNVDKVLYNALQYVPDDESRINAVNLLQGVIGVTNGAKGMDIESVIEGLKKIRDTATEVAKPFIFNMKANVESGQSLMNNLKEGFRFKRDWYPALRAIDVSLRSGKLSEVKQLINQAPSYRDPAFQLGLCQRLGELAINPFWDMNARQDAIDLLIEIYKNDTIWGQHEGVKKWILHILCQLKDSSDVTISEKA
ncbi:hypothetical protein BGZ46_001184, partial [Entomortierella lignicola]